MRTSVQEKKIGKLRKKRMMQVIMSKLAIRTVRSMYNDEPNRRLSNAAAAAAAADYDVA